LELNALSGFKHWVVEYHLKASYALERSMVKKRVHKMFVYVMESDGGFYKVGISNSPKTRKKELQTGNPCDIEIYDYYEVLPHFSSKDVESRIHKRLDAYRVGGEWFKMGFESATELLFAISAEQQTGALGRSNRKRHK